LFYILVVVSVVVPLFVILLSLPLLVAILMIHTPRDRLLVVDERNTMIPFARV